MKILLLFALLGLTAAAHAIPLVSADGKTKDFSAVISASPKGLTVRETATSRELLVPWERLDLEANKKALPWLSDAHAKAKAGATVSLEKAQPTVSTNRSSSVSGDWTILKSTVPGGQEKNFTSLALTAYVHKEVKKPRLAVVWVGADNALAARPDAADFARRMAGALVVAQFAGDYADAAAGSGAALVGGLAELFAEQNGGKAKAAVKPALILIGRGAPASFVWSMLCSQAADVLAAVTIDGKHTAQPNAGAFSTPLLFVQTGGQADLSSVGEDLELPLDLWRHYSTDGCRWAFANAANASEALTLAVAFSRDVAAASPYQEVVAEWEDYENNELKHRIPPPNRSVKQLKEGTFQLASLGARETYSEKAKTGAARNDLIWLPGPNFTKLLKKS